MALFYILTRIVEKEEELKLTDALVLWRTCFFVQLQLCFYILCGKSDADLNASGYPPCEKQKNSSIDWAKTSRTEGGSEI